MTPPAIDAQHSLGASPWFLDLLARLQPTPNLHYDDVDKEIREKKKTRLLQELEQLNMEYDQLAEDEELIDLEEKVEAARKRVEERRQRVNYHLERKLLGISPNGNEPGVQSKSDHHTPNRGQPGTDFSSPGSSKQHRNANHRESEGTKEPYSFPYYADLDPHGQGKAQPLQGMGLDQLRRLMADADGAGSNSNPPWPSSHVYYYTYLQTKAIEDLERAVTLAKEQIPTEPESHEYEPRLKDLIVMLIKRYGHTNLVEDLQEAIFRAQEMVVATSPDHPERALRLTTWVDMMFYKFGRTQSEDDLNEAIIMAREAGVELTVQPENQSSVGFSLAIPG